jgi:hypothetical protein
MGSPEVTEVRGVSNLAHPTNNLQQWPVVLTLKPVCFIVKVEVNLKNVRRQHPLDTLGA